MRWRVARPAEDEAATSVRTAPEAGRLGDLGGSGAAVGDTPWLRPRARRPVLQFAPVASAAEAPTSSAAQVLQSTSVTRAAETDFERSARCGNRPRS